MPSVTFYLLPESDAESKTLHLQHACDLVAEQFRSKRRLWVYCNDQQEAEQFDELLWQRPADSFIPHNLVGEGPAGGAPIEISWKEPERVNRPVLVNLHQSYPAFSTRYQNVIDFVPAEEELKKLARTRYKHYRAAGFEMFTQPLENRIETENG